MRFLKKGDVETTDVEAGRERRIPDRLINKSFSPLRKVRVTVPPPPNEAPSNSITSTPPPSSIPRKRMFDQILEENADRTPLEEGPLQSNFSTPILPSTPPRQVHDRPILRRTENFYGSCGSGMDNLFNKSMDYSQQQSNSSKVPLPLDSLPLVNLRSTVSASDSIVDAADRISPTLESKLGVCVLRGS